LIYRAVVSNNDDSTMVPKDTPMSRIKIDIPERGLLGVWAYLNIPYVGNDAGFVFIPENKSLVWVTQWGKKWVVLGGCATKGKMATNAKPKVKVLRTKKFTIEIDDEANEMRIKSIDGNGKLLFNDGNLEVI